MNVYLVASLNKTIVYAIFAAKEDAISFSKAITSGDHPVSVAVEVVERTLWYGQPTTRGFNL